MAHLELKLKIDTVFADFKVTEYLNFCVMYDGIVWNWELHMYVLMLYLLT
jgi:hypothetical protein